MRPEVIPFLIVAVGLGAILTVLIRLVARTSWKRAARPGVVVALVLCAYLFWFFRDPTRVPPDDELAIAAGAEGKIANVVELTPEHFKRIASFNGLEGDQLEAFLDGNVTRISIFLSLLDVHVNRAPISGTSHFLGYFKGNHYFTFQEKSSEHNQHNSILIVGDRTLCLVNQIVGPVARRVVYWPDKDNPVNLKKGDKIGMMKFGSRLDMYFPSADIEVTVGEGDFVRAGQTVVARERVEEDL